MRTTSLAHADPAFRDVVAPVCHALQSVVEEDFHQAATLLETILPRAEALGGSAAQRDVLQDTLVYALTRSGQGQRAAQVLDERLDRRASALDARHRASLGVQVSPADRGIRDVLGRARSSGLSNESCCGRFGEQLGHSLSGGV